MLDFIKVSTRVVKRGGKEVFEIYPEFLVRNSTDLMIRGGDFYAIWDEERKIWSMDEQDVVRLIDDELRIFRQENGDRYPDASVAWMYKSSTGTIDKWHKYCQYQMRDSYVVLDETIMFSNADFKKEDYASKRLSYPLEKGPCPSWEKLISTLYSPDERHKIEWAIGAIVTGESKELQKFMVLYGAAGTGKSTVMNIIQDLFEGYDTVFDARALGNPNSSFALEPFRSNPLVAIQHDGDLSGIADNTRLNSVVSHELMTINEKFKSSYTNRFRAFLIMGTNKPVKITDGKSGLLRRLIDVYPSGNKLGAKEYKRVMSQMKFELGAIAWHCKEVYLSDPEAYDDYVPILMMDATNDFYNFVMDSYRVFRDEDGTTLNTSYEMYKLYCDDAKVGYPLPKRAFKEELKNYFAEYIETFKQDNGRIIRGKYVGFLTTKFETKKKEKTQNEEEKTELIDFKDCNPGTSVFDIYCADCPAQGIKIKDGKEIPYTGWKYVKTKLRDIDTSEVHYVKVPEKIITVDFDLKDENGNKSFERNLEAASKWPKTYAELSKSGEGIHLEYIYTGGDPSMLSRIYDTDIEIKVAVGDSSLRRKLTKCNNEPIATISSGLPLKGEKVISKDIITTEKGIYTTIKRSLNKEYHGNTKCEIDWIFKILEDAYNSGVKYTIPDYMINAIVEFASNSTNNADYCLNRVAKMHFRSETPMDNIDNTDSPLIFYDVEVFINLLVVCWKAAGEGKPVVRMINPKPSDIEDLIKFRLIGFNNRNYDNHILYARMMGYTNEQLYDLSQRIINSKKGDRNNGKFGNAYNLSYTDIYDFASAGNKKSLKKLEIEMGVHHQELGLPWDKPVPEHLWNKVADYCCNDVIATEVAFYYLKGDWTARQILAELAGMTVNDTTNTLTTKIIFGDNRTPQSEFCWRDLSKPVFELKSGVEDFLREYFPEMMSIRHGEAGSLLPYFPGYKYEAGVSTYRGEVVGEGGYVWAEPGMHGDDALLDVMSMHPHSAMAECLFGPRFTQAYHDIVYGRVSIKHEAWDVVNDMLDGKLTPFVQRVINGEMTSGDLANALKTAINSVYGLTAAGFENPFRDPRNVDNIVAKRGALFMIDLKHEVQNRGFTVAHIKTDSIKIPDATAEIIQFVMDFGKKYGYTFEHEATYEKMCLVNDAVYIAKYKDGKHAGEWTATGKQFAVPYVFKTLFSHEPIVESDMCETFAVSKGDLYLDMNESMPDVSEWEKEHEKLVKKISDPQRIGEDMTKECERLEELTSLIETGHHMQYVGRVGQFSPIKPGYGGGELYRVNEGKKFAAPGSTGYRWLESEMIFNRVNVQQDGVSDYSELVTEANKAGREPIPGNLDIIDRSYYQKLVDAAVDTISKYGDFEWFVSDDPYISKPKMPDFMNIPEDVVDEELPFV